jgi:hypothetical protein
MATRVRAIAHELIDTDKATAWNTQTGMSLTPAQWQAAFGVVMADSEIQSALTVAKNREAAWVSLIGAMQSMANSAGSVGEADYMNDALTQALTLLVTNLQRPFDPATDTVLTAEAPQAPTPPE